MSKESLYIADSGGEPSSLIPAQEAFFRYQYTLGSYEYALRTGRDARVQALAEELQERYDAYTALRDGRSVAYNLVAGGSPDLDYPTPARERPPLRPNELPPELAEFLKD